jgi:hypothetical protein
MGKRSYPGNKRNDVATKRAAERTTDRVQVSRDSRGDQNAMCLDRPFSTPIAP